MAANAVSTRELNVHEVTREKAASESGAPVALRQRFETLLCAVFEGHKEISRPDAGLARPPCG
jgi:hypothetical protein